MDRKIIQQWLPSYIKFRKARGSEKQPTDVDAIVGGHKDGDLFVSSTHYCFSGVPYHFGSGQSDAMFFQVQDWTPYCSEEAAMHFYEWLLNYSPFRSIFITKRVERIKKDRVIVVDTSAPHNLITCGIITMRMPWEKNDPHDWRISCRIQNWWDMVDKGLAPKEALLIAHTFAPLERGSEQYTVNGGSGVGHLPMNTTIDGTFINFINEALVSGKVFSKSGGMSSNAAYGHTFTSDIIPDRFNKLLLDLNKDGIVNTNPFKQENKHSTISKDMMMEARNDFASIIHERIAQC